MKLTRWVGVGLVVCVLAAIVWQRSVLAGLRNDNEALLQAAEKAGRIVERQASKGAVGGPPSTELLRLRNEVRQLRDQSNNWERLKQANQQLKGEIQAGGVQAAEFRSGEGFVARESWINAGFATPEAALQTFFWALTTGDILRVSECLPARESSHLALLAQPGHEAERDKMLAEFRQMTAGPGFRIVEKGIEEEGYITAPGAPPGSGQRLTTKVKVRIQAMAGGAVMPMSFVLGPDGWKIKEF